MRQLCELILDALLDCGYDVIGALEVLNTEYRPQIKALPVGRHVLNIGKHEITFRKDKKS